MATTADLDGRRVLVVGASSGIGREVAVQAGRAGARVAVAARRLDRLEELAGALDDAVTIGCDVRDPAACRSVVARTVDAFDGLDALVYVAGTAPLVPLAEATAEQWAATLETNLVGAALVAAAAAPHLEASQGRAVFVSSQATRRPYPGIGLYSTSKVALDGFIVALRAEHPELDVTRVTMGNVGGTEFADAWEPAALEQAMEVWTETGAMPSASMMPVHDAAEAILTVLAVEAHIDDLAVIERPSDAQ